MKVTGCSLGEVFMMTASNPAKLHNLTDRGTIEPGKRADIIMFSIENSEMKIERTFVCGKEVYTR